METLDIGSCWYIHGCDDFVKIPQECARLRRFITGLELGFKVGDLMETLEILRKRNNELQFSVLVTYQSITELNNELRRFFEAFHAQLTYLSVTLDGPEDAAQEVCETIADLVARWTSLESLELQYYSAVNPTCFSLDARYIEQILKNIPKLKRLVFSTSVLTEEHCFAITTNGSRLEYIEIRAEVSDGCPKLVIFSFFYNFTLIELVVSSILTVYSFKFNFVRERLPL